MSALFESNSLAEEVRKAKIPCPLVTSRAGVCVYPLKGLIHARHLDLMTSLALLQSVVPTCFKETTIVPVPKKTKTLCINDYCLVALTSTIMERFKHLVKTFITSSLPDSQ